MPKVSTNQRITFTQSREAGGTNRVEHKLVPVRKNQNLETVAYRSYLLKINVTFSYGFDVANINASVLSKMGQPSNLSWFAVMLSWFHYKYNVGLCHPISLHISIYYIHHLTMLTPVSTTSINHRFNDQGGYTFWSSFNSHFSWFFGLLPNSPFRSFTSVLLTIAPTLGAMYQAMNEGCDRRSRASDAARVGIAPRSGDLRKVSLGMNSTSIAFHSSH